MPVKKGRPAGTRATAAHPSVRVALIQAAQSPGDVRQLTVHGIAKRQEPVGVVVAIVILAMISVMVVPVVSGIAVVVMTVTFRVVTIRVIPVAVMAVVIFVISISGGPLWRLLRGRSLAITFFLSP